MARRRKGDAARTRKSRATTKQSGSPSRSRKPARSARATEPEPETTPAGLARRAGWVVLAGAWLFVALALLSFDAADPPSHAVAVHNAPVANLCGAAGALVAYWSWQVLGLGSWVVVAGLGLALLVTGLGRRIDNPLLRAAGLLFIAVAAAGLHRLLLPGSGPLVGARAGLLAEFLVGELAPRFSTVGSLLLLLAAAAVGAIVAMDEIVLALPALVRSAARRTVVLRRFGRALSLRPGFLRRRGGFAETDVEDAATELDADDEDVEWDEVDEDDDEVDVYEDEDEDVDELDEAEDGAEDEVAAPESPDRRRLTEAELRAKIAKLPVRLSGTNRAVARDEDIPREQSFEDYRFPTLDLLADPETNYSEKMESIVREQARALEAALDTYGIDGEVVGIESGPVVTDYAIQLAPGTKVAKLNAISSDLARALSSHNVRIVPNSPGKSTVGIEVPNPHKERVRLKELMSGGHAEGMHLPMFLGKDASGEPLVADLTRMPHMLIAGTTGSGKSVCMNTIIMSWLYTKRPNELKLVLVDPKMVELGQFADIPHLMCPVVTEMSRAAAILEWAVNKMEERYELLREARVRDVGSYNALTEEELYETFEPQNDEERARIPKKLPFIVFVIDELADLMLTHREVEQHIVRIAQKARAVGIHLIVATQRPQANVVTGLIKSNMPCRISFKVASGMDSRIVLDQKGAELLLGQGDMLFLSPHSHELRRAQGTLVVDGEIRKVARFLKDVAAPSFERQLLAIRPGGADELDGDALAERDPMFDRAVEIMIESGRGSVSLLQRRLAIGYSRASRLVDQMGLAGILGEHRGSVARDVLITLEEWQQMKALEAEQAAEGTLFDGEQDDDPDGLDEPATAEVETFPEGVRRGA